MLARIPLGPPLAPSTPPLVGQLRSVRRRLHAPVSTPLNWSEVKPTLVPSEFNIGNFEKRLKQTSPWNDFFENRQSLKDAMRLLKLL